MRGIAMAAVLCAGLWAGARAQPGAVEEEYVEYQKRAEEEGPDPELETQHYDRQLKLSAEQRKRLRALFEARRASFRKGRAARERIRAETEEAHRRLKALNERFAEDGRRFEAERAERRKALRALLTAAQREAYDKLAAEQDRQDREFVERKVREDLRRHGGDGVQGRWGGPAPEAAP